MPLRGLRQIYRRKKKNNVSRNAIGLETYNRCHEYLNDTNSNFAVKQKLRITSYELVPVLYLLCRLTLNDTFAKVGNILIDTQPIMQLNF